MRRQITTREELDALPVGSVGRDADGYTFERFACLDYPGAKARWFMMCDDLPTGTDDIALPATVLWRPDEDEADGDEREVLASAAGSVLCNAMNFPEPAIVRLLGQDMAPLIETTTDAVLAAGFRHQGAVTVSRARVEAAIRAADDEARSYRAKVNGEPLYGPESDMPENIVRRVIAALGFEVSD